MIKWSHHQLIACFSTQGENEQFGIRPSPETSKINPYTPHKSWYALYCFERQLELVGI